MARVSQFFGLTRTQPTLDFVDVDMSTDLRIYIDPHAIRLVPTDWGNECVALIEDFFAAVMDAIRAGDHERARSLLSALREPNETHLGMSADYSRGRGMGRGSAHQVWDALRKSEAVTSGLLEDLEDTVLLVDGIGTDIISDITTNIIRQPLIAYTQAACRWYGIPMEAEVDSGPLWDPETSKWASEYAELPIGEDGKLLLVPKSIVRRNLAFSADEYYRNYILADLAETELHTQNSALVRTLKSGERKVAKRDLIEKYGRGKSVNLSQTRINPALLSRYRNDKRTNVTPPLEHGDLAEAENTPPPDWPALLDAVTGIVVGRDGATEYEQAIEALLSALFYPSLSNPQPQRVLHDGRKRVDIVYSNTSVRGFFSWLAGHYRAPHVFVECKNYSGDPANPELDQLAGRFSERRGQFGILVCRSIVDKALFAQRCRDTADDGRGFIIYLDDDDLRALVAARQALGIADRVEFQLLRDRFEGLIL